MEAYFFTFNKKINSTKQPSIENGTLVNDVVLKNTTSYLQPTLILDTKMFTTPMRYGSWNYCLFNGRYYWVTDCRAINYRLLEISLTVDVLASYKADITSTTCYIERCSDSGYYNTSLYDSYMPMRDGELNVYQEVGENTSGYLSKSGTYLITVVGGNGNPTSFGTTTYKATIATLTNALDFLFNENNFKDTFTDTLVKTFFNPFQYILNCVWIPIAYDKIPSTKGTFKFGWWDSKDEAEIVTSDGVEFNTTITVPSPAYKDFRFYSPQWTTCELYLPCFGRINLPLDRVKYGDTLNIKYAVDYSTGDVMCSIADANIYLSGNCATPISISQNRPNIEGVISGATQVGMGIVSGDYFSAGVGAFQGLQSAQQPSPSSNGASGSRRPLISFFNSYCTIYQKMANDFPQSEMGRPCYKSDRIGNLDGYVKCLNASISISGGYESERQMVNQYLNGGVYIE